MKEKFIT